jgi:hypothetical protein
MDSSDEECASDSSFGHDILMAAGIERPLHAKYRGQESQTDTSDDESGDMENIGDLLEEALSVCHDSEKYPSPPKKPKDNHQSPQVKKSRYNHSVRLIVFVVAVCILLASCLVS